MSYIREFRSDLDLFTTQLRECGKDVLQAEMLGRKDRLTILHFLCQQNDENEIYKFFEVLKTNFDEDFVKKFILNRKSTGDNKNSTFLHILPKSENISIVEVLKIVAIDYGEDFMNELLFAREGHGWTLLHVLAYHQYKKNRMLQFFEEFLKVFGVRMLQDLILVESTDGDTFLHTLSVNEKTSDFMEFWNVLGMNFDKKLIQDLFMVENNRGQTFFQFFCVKKGRMAFEDLISFMHKNMDIVVLKIMFGSKRMLHVIALNYRLPICDVMKTLTQVFEKSFMQEFLLTKDLRKQTFLFKLNKNDSSILNLFQLLAAMFDKSLVEELISSEDFNSNTFLDNLAQFMEPNLFLKLVSFLMKIYENGLLRKMIASDDILFSFCTRNRNVPFQEFNEFLKENFDKEFIRKLLKSKNFFGKTILHLYRLFTGDFLEVIKSWSSEYSADFVRELLSINSQWNETILHNLCRRDRMLDFEGIYKYLSLHFGKEFVQELLSSRNPRGDSILHYLAKYNQKTLFVSLFRMIIDDFGYRFIKELFIAKDNYGDTVFGILGKFNDTVVFKELFRLLD